MYPLVSGSETDPYRQFQGCADSRSSHPLLPSGARIFHETCPGGHTDRSGGWLETQQPRHTQEKPSLPNQSSKKQSERTDPNIMRLRVYGSLGATTCTTRLRWNARPMSDPPSNTNTRRYRRCHHCLFRDSPSLYRISGKITGFRLLCLLKLREDKRITPCASRRN
jgi:hypothetical protein